jgi:alkylation response protein AidB-like acyl-CoA dehydrogenase
MALVLNEEQQILKDTAREFITARAPISELRRLRDEQSAVGFDRKTWASMTELGWPAILIPETYGGADFGMQGLGAVLEETGRTLSASALISTALIGASLINKLGTDEQRATWLSAIAKGDLVTALALEEGPHHNPTRIETSAHRDGDHFVLDGEKTFVLDGNVADLLLIVARTSGDANDETGLSIFACPPETPGIIVERMIMVDSRNAANVQLSGVRCPATMLLGTTSQVGTARAPLEQVLDLARIGLSAEMLGSVSEAFDRTMAYLKTRHQFGALIGSFQALKHRAAVMFSEIELARSAVMGALEAAQTEADSTALLASLAKARLADTFHLVSDEAVQMHGGIGMTDEEEIGFFMKRARVAEQTFGDAKFHRARYARLSGF